MNPLRLLILSDGRPGHFNLAEGIAAAVARLRPLAIERRDARRGRWPGLAAAGLANAGLPPAVMLRAVYGLDAATLPPADLVVSAGAETLAANVWLARINIAPNIFYGSLRAFRPVDFALVLTSYERNADRPNHALFLKPSKLDPDTLPSSTHRAAIAREAPPRLMGLLVGGDSGTIKYAADDWAALLDFVVDLHRQCGSRWLVANSRRTPDTISDRLAALAGGGDSAIERFLDVRSAGPGTLGPILAAADAMIATDEFEQHDLGVRMGAAAGARSQCRGRRASRGRNPLSRLDDAPGLDGYAADRATHTGQRARYTGAVGTARPQSAGRSRRIDPGTNSDVVCLVLCLIALRPPAPAPRPPVRAAHDIECHAHA